MARDGETFEHWLDEAKIPQWVRSTPQQLAVLRAAFDFLQHTGKDYASRRIAGHFLMHCQSGLKLAQVARLVGVDRSTASRQSKESSRQVVRAIQHQLCGRAYGKLLPRYAGPVAQFLVTHPQASRDDVLDFIESTWDIRVSLTALHRFLNKYGLNRQSLDETRLKEPPHVVEDEQALIEVLDQPPLSGLPLPCPPDDCFFGETQYAGAFLLMPQVLRWWETAQECFSDEYGSLQQGFLTSVFMPLVGIERVFHLEQMDDAGFAVLTGDPSSCPSRHVVGAWRKNLVWNEVDRFCHRTSPWELLHEQDSLISFDEHSIPRWTKKFSIPKGYVTTRNKYMRCEKLYYGYDPAAAAVCHGQGHTGKGRIARRVRAANSPGVAVR